MPENSPASGFTFRYSATISINYEIHGRGGRRILFLHGFAAALTTWHDLIPFFSPEASTLYLLDLKGFGFSTKPRGEHYTVEEQASIVTAFLEHEKLSDVILAGHSLGGGIALLAYLQACRDGKRDLVGALILIACAAYPQRLPKIMRWMRKPLLGFCILHLLPLRLMVRYTLEHVIYDRRAITEARMVRYMGCFGRKGIAHVFIETCRQLVPQRYAGQSLLYRTISVPTLIIWGSKDRIIPLSAGERLHREIPGSRLIVLECGHVPQEERPEQTYAAIRDFIRLGSPNAPR